MCVSTCLLLATLPLLGMQLKVTHDLLMSIFFFYPLRVILPGCLAQPQSAKAQQLLRTLIHSKQKVRWTYVAEPSSLQGLSLPLLQESLMEVSRCLLEAVSQEGLSVKLTGRLGRPSAAQLQGFLQLFRSAWPSSLTNPQVPLTCPHTPSHLLTEGTLMQHLPAGSAAAGLCSCGGSHWRQEQALGGNGQHREGVFTTRAVNTTFDR